MEPAPRPTVLVLDDEPVARDLLRRYLARHGYDMVETGTTADALEAFRRVPVDAVILDVRLPETLTGLDVLRTLRQEGLRPAVPVIILTGAVLTEEEELEVTRNRGFLFRKPESFETLVKFVDQLTGRDQPQ